MTKADERLIFSDDWYVDGEGRNWSVVAIDVDRKEVRLRLVDPPERTVPVEDLRKNYKLGGLRRFKLEGAASAAEVEK